MFPWTRHLCGGVAGIVLALLFLAGPGISHSAPANDACAGAEVIPGSGPFPYFTAIIPDISTATTNGDPVNTCIDVSNGIWYRFTPATTRLYTISAGTDTASTVEDSVIAIYTSPTSCGAMTEFACNDDEAGTKAGVARTFTSGTTYYIVVSVGPNGLSEGATAIQLRISTPVIPANDACTAAATIPAAGPFPYLTPLVDVTLATTNGEPAASCAVFSHTVWYSFTPSLSGVYEFSTCSNNTATTVRDTVIALYRATNCAATRVSIACEDDICNTRASVAVALQAGTAYHIRVGEFDADEPTLGETLIQLSVNRAQPPTVTTLPADMITSASALAHASINPNGLGGTYWFEWGTDLLYGTSTPSAGLPSDSTAIAVASFLPGLAPGVTYHYRAVASNAVGQAVGLDQSFRWDATEPFVQMRRLTNASVELRFVGQTSQTYFVESTRNFAEWLDIGTATNLGTTFFFIDSAASSLSSRFYRVFSP